MKRAALIFCLLASPQCPAAEPGSLPDWIVASADARANAGERFEVLVLHLGAEPLPDRIAVRMKGGAGDHTVTLSAQGPVLGRQQVYAGIMPAGLSGPVELQLAGRQSSVLVLMVTSSGAEPMPAPEPVGKSPQGIGEPPISENDPMYFIVGGRGGYSARFQLSFKYRLFDQSSGFGQDQTWLSGLYFGYTQNSVWDLSAQSKPFRDTSYRPSLFWKWERADDRTWIDAVRLGVEHESNGGGQDRSRSVDTVFVRPEWRWGYANGARLEFTPKLYGYLDKDENPDINHYRGNVDWRLRYDTGDNWIATGVARVPNSGQGSMLVDLSRRVRDLRFGPVGGYLHFQLFTGYGEDILDYNLRRKTQLRIGFAIVP